MDWIHITVPVKNYVQISQKSTFTASHDLPLPDTEEYQLTIDSLLKRMWRHCNGRYGVRMGVKMSGRARRRDTGMPSHQRIKQASRTHQPTASIPGQLKKAHPTPACSPRTPQSHNPNRSNPETPTPSLVKMMHGSQSQLGETFCGRGSHVLGRLVHDLEARCGRLAENGVYGCRQARRDERTLTGPVVVHVAVDSAEMVGEVDVDSGSDHRDQGEEQRI